MKNLKRIILCAIVVFTLAGCESLKVTHYGNTPEEMKKVVILSTMIDRIYQPTLPLIDAGIFNGKTNEIAEEIIIIQEAHANEYREILASSFQNHFHCQVIYGDTLHNHPEFENLAKDMDRPGDLYTGNDNFPMMSISDGDINPFAFSGMRFQPFFQQEVNYRYAIGKIAEKLEVDYVALSVSQLSVQSVGPFGGNGGLALKTKLYIFNHDGKLVSEASNMSASLFIKGKDPQQYDVVLGNFSILIEPMMDQIEARYKSNNNVASGNTGQSNPYLQK